MLKYEDKFTPFSCKVTSVGGAKLFGFAQPPILNINQNKAVKDKRKKNKDKRMSL